MLALSVLWGGSFFFTAIAVAGAAAVHDRRSAGRPRGAASLFAAVLRVAMPRGAAMRGAPSSAWAPQQRRAVLPDRLGPDPHRLRARLDPQRHDPAVHRRRRASLTQDEKMTGGRAGGRPRRFRRGGGHDRPRGVRRLGDERPGAARRASRRRFPMPSPAFTAGVSGAGRRPDGDGRRSGRRVEPRAPPSRCCRRPAVGAPHARAAPGPRWRRSPCISTALAYVLYFRILAHRRRHQHLLVTLPLPVSAILLGASVLGETPRPGALHRHGADRPRPRGHRRAPAGAPGPPGGALGRTVVDRVGRCIEDTPVVDPWHAARLVRQHRLDGSPFVVGEFIAHNSKLACSSGA